MAKRKFYAVAKGNKTGIFSSWEECEAQVKGFRGAKYKSFTSADEAKQYLEQHVEKSCDKTQKEPPTKRLRRTCEREIRVRSNFDGGSRGNPGIAGAGIAVTISEVKRPRCKESGADPYWHSIHKREFLGLSFTNNEAEYHGAICALQCIESELQKYLAILPNKDVAIEVILQGDSDLIIQQVKGNYQCRQPNLQPLLKKAQNHIRNIEKLGEVNLVMEHVLRSENSLADKLANQAMDARRSWETTGEDEGHHPP